MRTFLCGTKNITLPSVLSYHGNHVITWQAAVTRGMDSICLHKTPATALLFHTKYFINHIIPRQHLAPFRIKYEHKKICLNNPSLQWDTIWLLQFCSPLYWSELLQDFFTQNPTQLKDKVHTQYSNIWQTYYPAESKHRNISIHRSLSINITPLKNSKITINLPESSQ